MTFHNSPDNDLHHNTIRLDQWVLKVDQRLISHVDQTTEHTIEPKTLDVLMVLISRAGHTVSRDEFMQAVWQGRHTVEESLTRCISELRKAFNDNPKSPSYIKTVPKKGYQLLVEPVVVAQEETKTANESSAPPPARSVSIRTLSLFAFIAFALVSVMVWETQSPHATAEKDKPAPKTGLSVTTQEQLKQLFISAANANSTITVNHQSTQRQYKVTVATVESTSLPSQQARVSVYDEAGNLLWQAQRDFNSEAQRILIAKDLAKVFGLLDTSQHSPEITTLSPKWQHEYKRALYLMDKRGEKNLLTAISTLDALLYEQPDFVMALVQQALAVRMLSSYQTDLETRQKSIMRFDLLLKQAKSIAPEHPVVKSLTFNFDPFSKDWHTYEGILLDAVAYSPACTICVRNLAELYLSLGYYERAVSILVKHLDYFPLSVSMHSFLGIVYGMQGDIEKTHHQADIVEALGEQRGFDALSVRLQAVTMEGDHKAFDEISKKLLAQHPAFSQRLEVMHTLIRGDVEKARQLISNMPFLDFNLAISSGMFEEVLERANRNIPKGQLRDLSFTHGWLLPETYIFPVYTHNLSTFKSKPEVITLLKNTGQFSYWREQNRWPDYCEFERYKSHRPSFCDERL